MTPPATWSPWNEILAAATNDRPLALTAAQCARLIDFHNELVGAKNDLARDNWGLLEKLKKVTGQS